jgi:hypothetical protein
MAPLALGCAFLIARAALAQDMATDVNIVTALDLSTSVDPSDMRVELSGMALAIRDPRVLEAIRMGERRRIGFAVFGWHHSQFPTIVSWTLIETDDDAIRVSREIEARLSVDVESEAREHAIWYIGRLTDLSQAIDHAGELLQAAPFPTKRAVINIVGDGKDNVGEDAPIARDRFLEGGGTVNGVVLNADPVMIAYFEEKVVGGPGAFVMSTTDHTVLVDVLVRKFIGDIIADATIGSGKAAIPVSRQAPVSR